MPRKRRWRTILLGIAGGLCVWLLILMIQIACYANVRDDGPADAAIVLGAAVWEDAPSPVFAARLDHAIALYHRGRVRALIFTGGIGEGDTLAESEVARIYALAQGVPATGIFTETVSYITLTNLTEAQRLVREQGFDRVLLVSDPLHMKRAITIARDLGLNAYPSPTPTTRYRTWKTKTGFLLREVYYYTGYLLRRFLSHQGISISTSAVIPSAVRRGLHPVRCKPDTQHLRRSTRSSSPPKRWPSRPPSPTTRASSSTPSLATR